MKLKLKPDDFFPTKPNLNFKGSFSKCDSILSKKFSLNLLNAFLTVENGHKIRNSQSECINSSIEQVEAERKSIGSGQSMLLSYHKEIKTLFCSICANYACFASSCMAKHIFTWENQQCCTSVRDH